MTRETHGGVPPLSDAWIQAEKAYLDGAAPQSDTIIVGAITLGKTATTSAGSTKVELPRVVPVLLLASALLSSTSLVLPSQTEAQTVFGGRGRQVSTTPPGKSTASPAPTSSVTPNSPATEDVPAVDLPVSKGVVRQAEAQIDGNFPAMKRAEVGGQIQEAWNNASPRDPVQTFRLCDDCVYKVRLREFMVTTLVLPPDAQVASADPGDSSGFQVQVKANNMLAVRPVSYGMDTNLNVYTQSGRVYPFYLRAESFNSKNVPDVLVRIVGRETPPKIESVTPIDTPPGVDGEGRQGKDGDSAPADKSAKDGKADKIAEAVKGLTTPKADEGDFIRSVPFDPDNMHGWDDYHLWGGGEDKTALKPDRIWRDDHFTYLQYNKKKFAALDYPNAFVVKDGIDFLVNSRVQGRTIIIERVAPLLTLKLGKSFLCIQYTGETP